MSECRGFGKVRKNVITKVALDKKEIEEIKYLNL